MKISLTRGRGPLIAGIAAAAVLAPAASASASGVTVNFGILQGATLASTAQHIGSLQTELAKVGAKVSFKGPFPAMTPAVEALDAGDVDITYGSISAAVGALAGNADFKIFAIEPEQPKLEGIIAAPGSGITSLKDLKGKTIAVNKAGTGEYLTLLALKKAGLSTSEVNLVDLTPTEAASAFGSGHVDAWATWSTFTGLALDQLHGKMIADGGELGSLNDTPYIVSNSFAQKNPKVVAAVYKGLKDAITWIDKNKKSAQAYFEKEGLAPEVAKTQVENAGDLEPITSSKLSARFQKVANFVFQQKVVPVKVSMAKDIFNIQKTAK